MDKVRARMWCGTCRRHGDWFVTPAEHAERAVWRRWRQHRERYHRGDGR